jgi:hypothetical protein
MTTIKLARDARSGATITLDLSLPRAIFVTGKRGSGKTTTLHRLATHAAEAGATAIAIDPIGALLALCSSPSPVGTGEGRGGGVHRLTPGDNLLLNPSDLSTDAWLALFALSLSQPGGILLSRAIRKSVNSANPCYTIPDLIAAVESDDRANSATIEAIANRLEAAHHGWNIFRQHGYQDLAETFTPGLHLVDLSTLDPGPHSLRNLTVSLLVSRLFAYAQAAQTSPSAGGTEGGENLILIIDEAHNFANSPALAATPLTRWAREGRNYGLSLVLATQRPTALPADTLSQADILVIHRLTLLADVKAVGNLASTYARDLAAILKGIRDPGQAIIVDDQAERAVVGRVISE